MTYKRRQFLKDLSLGGSSLAMAPFLHSLRVHAEGDEAAFPKRFVFVVKSSGIDKFNLVPDGLTNHFVDEKSGQKLGNRSRREGALVDAADETQTAGKTCGSGEIQGSDDDHSELIRCGLPG